jgi:hypothetical protein
MLALLKKGSRAFYGAGEGMFVLDQIDFWNNADCTNCNGGLCDICLQCGGGQDNCNWNTLQTTLTNTGSTGTIGAEKHMHVAHELGHCVLGLGDEYDTQNGYVQCGHTIMGNQSAIGLVNFCYEDTGVSPALNDHNTDKNPLNASNSSYSPGWTVLNTKLGAKPYETPDAFDFGNFDFGDLIGKVVQH